jgi:hypothetical protein
MFKNPHIDEALRRVLELYRQDAQAIREKIAALEECLGDGPMGSDAGAPPRAAAPSAERRPRNQPAVNSGDLDRDLAAINHLDLRGITTVAACQQVLRALARPLRVKALCELLNAKGMARSEAAVNQELIRSGAFVRVARGTYALARKHEERR